MFKNHTLQSILNETEPPKTEINLLTWLTFLHVLWHILCALFFDEKLLIFRDQLFESRLTLTLDSKLHCNQGVCFFCWKGYSRLVLSTGLKGTKSKRWTQRICRSSCPLTVAIRLNYKLTLILGQLDPALNNQVLGQSRSIFLTG